MISEEEFQEFKLQVQKQQLKRARSTSIVLGMAAVISILFMIYGLTQNISATAHSEMARIDMQHYQKEIKTLKEQLAKCQSEKNK